jgi:hypothetical protein
VKADDSTRAENPYQPPSSDALPLADEPVGWEPAERWRRFGTFVVDYICLVVVSGVALGIVLGIVFGDAERALDGVPDMVIGLVAMTLYYVFFEGIWHGRRGNSRFARLSYLEDKSSSPPQRVDRVSGGAWGHR